MASLKPVMNFLAIFLVLILLPCSADSARARMCGKKLINILKKLCNHRYRTPSPKQVNFDVYRIYQQSQRGGIVDACCYKSCSYSYLMSYCALPPTSTQSTTTLNIRTTRAAKQQTKRRKDSRKRSNQPQIKTFRSLFHLLHTISGYLEKELTQDQNNHFPKRWQEENSSKKNTPLHLLPAARS